MFAVVCQPGPNWDPKSPVTKQHLEVFTGFIAGVNRKGSLDLAGILGEGVFYILNVGSLEEAKAIVSEDPTIQSGIFRAEVHPFVTRISNMGYFNDVEAQRSGSF